MTPSARRRWSIEVNTREETAEFTLRWSPWGSMDKWVINRIVPSEAGLFQLWVIEGRGFSLLTTRSAFYGGLRSTLREIIDELAPSGRHLRTLIAERECWFRFSTTPVHSHLQQLEAWFDGSAVLDEVLDESNREVLVNELEDLRKFPLPPRDIAIAGRRQMNDADFGFPLG